MKRLLKAVGDIAVSVGCCVGVGFLSGKEAQIFFGNGRNVIIFAVIFGISSFAVREFCRVKQCASVGQLSCKLLSKGANAVNTAIVFCSYVCIVTVLAGAEQCLSQLLDIALPLPVFAFAAAVAAAVLCKANVNVVKWVNALLLLLCVVWLLLPAIRRGNLPCREVSTFQPVAYALFSVTMSLGITARLGTNCTQKENAAISFATAAITAMLMVAVMSLCDFDKTLPTLYDLDFPAKIFASVVLLLASVTGLAANALPVVEFVHPLIRDDVLSAMIVFGSALALSMFGFDFALRLGYITVAFVGAFVVAMATKKLVASRRRA